MSDAFRKTILIDLHVRERCVRKTRETSLNSRDNFGDDFYSMKLSWVEKIVSQLYRRHEAIWETT